MYVDEMTEIPLTQVGEGASAGDEGKDEEELQSLVCTCAHTQALWVLG